MKKERGISTVTVHAILAALALVLAYLTWTRDKTLVQQTDTVTILDVNKRDIQSISMEEEQRTVVVERKLDERGEPYAWITVTTRHKEVVTPPTPPQQPAAGAAPPAEKSQAPAKPAAASPPPAKAAPPAPSKPAAPPAGAPGPAKGGDKAQADKDAPSGEKAPPASTPPASTPPASTPPASTPPASTPPAPVHEVKETTTVKSFRGNEQADKLIEGFAPLSGLRALGKLDDAKAKELGLADSKKTLVVKLRGKTVKFTLGNTSYGAGDVYIRDPNGQVFLLAQRISSDFEFAESRLMERRMHRFERAELTRVEVKVGGKKKVLVQGKKDDPVNYFWASQETPDKKDDSLRNWMEKILRIAISDYVPRGEEPKAPEMSQDPGSAPQFGEVMTMTFFRDSKQLGHATFFRYPNPKAPTPEYFARTETTIGLVRLLSSSAESAIQDAEKW